MSNGLLVQEEHPTGANPEVGHLDDLYGYFDDPKMEVRLLALKILAGLSLDQDIKMGLGSDPAKYVSALFSKVHDHQKVAAYAWDALINFAVEHRVALYLIDHHLEAIMEKVCTSQEVFCEAATKLLSNLSKLTPQRQARLLPLLDRLLPLYLAGQCREEQVSCDRQFLASVLADFTTIPDGRLYFLREPDHLAALLPDLSNSKVVRRGGVASTLKNCLFETGWHGVILRREEEDDFVLTALIGRLYDHRVRLSEEERERLPVELQLREEGSEAESDPAIRTILIESLLILGTTRQGRNLMRRKQIYPILREWHLLEPSRELKTLLEDVVGLLIRDEEEEQEEGEEIRGGN